MNRTITRLRYIFLGIFLAAATGVAVWQVFWEIPAKNCLKAHKWWDYSQRVCATPVMISDITGRTILDKQAEAAAKAAVAPQPATAKP